MEQVNGHADVLQDNGSIAKTYQDHKIQVNPKHWQKDSQTQVELKYSD